MGIPMMFISKLGMLHVRRLRMQRRNHQWLAKGKLRLSMFVPEITTIGGQYHEHFRRISGNELCCGRQRGKSSKTQGTKKAAKGAMSDGFIKRIKAYAKGDAKSRLFHAEKTAYPVGRYVIFRGSSKGGAKPYVRISRCFVVSMLIPW